MATDLEQLIDMGFDKTRAEIAVKQTGGLQGALQWLEDNQDKPIEDIQAAEAAKADGDEDDEDTKAEISALEAGGQAKSLVCNDCGKRFRNQDVASYHASKTDHTDFSESSEEIAPLTEEEKKARLQELREKVAAKRAAGSIKDREEAARNEKIRQKATRESQDVKEELQRKEQIKEAARKRQEKLDDMEAKKRIKMKIEADKADRKRKADEAKAAREGGAANKAMDLGAGGASAGAPAPAQAAPTKPRVERNEARLRLQVEGAGNIMKTLPAETKLEELKKLVEEETGRSVTSFTTTFPRKVFEGGDLGMTLREAGLVPSSVLIVK